MRYIILIALLSLSCSAVKAQLHQSQDQTTQIKTYDQARLTAIQDFSTTKLFKRDSLFDVSLYDTLHRVAIDTISKNNYVSRSGKAYPEIVAVTISAFRIQFFLDTTLDISVQHAIPSRCVELHGKLFYWFDRHCPLTNSTIKILDNFHLIQRGGPSASRLFEPQSSGSIQGIDYYFCRNNMTVFKKVMGTRSLGNYDPPKVNCK